MGLQIRPRQRATIWRRISLATAVVVATDALLGQLGANNWFHASGLGAIMQLGRTAPYLSAASTVNPAVSATSENSKGQRPAVDQIIRNEWLAVLGGSVLPGNQTSKYPTLDDVNLLFNYLMEEYPGCISCIYAGQSLEKRDIKLYRLSLQGSWTQGPGPLNSTAHIVSNGSDSSRQNQNCLPIAAGTQVTPPTCLAGEKVFDLFRTPRDFIDHHTMMSVYQRTSPPAALITGVHHAREILSLTSTLYFLGLLLEIGCKNSHPPKSTLLQPGASLSRVNAGGPTTWQRHERLASAVIQSLLKTSQVFVLPVVNPDGYNYLSANAFARKNRHATCLGLENDEDAILEQGVDLNRNYGFDFKPSTNLNCKDEEYSGSHPFSEPETLAVRCVVDSFPIRTAANVHTYGDVWLRPMSCCNSISLPTEVEETYDELKRTVRTATQFGTAIEAIGYPAFGEATDWMLTKRGVIAVTPELGEEAYHFSPPPKILGRLSSKPFWDFLDIVSKAGVELEVEVDQFMARRSNSGHTATHTTPHVRLRLRNSGLTSFIGSPRGVTLLLFAATIPSARQENYYDVRDIENWATVNGLKDLLPRPEHLSQAIGSTRFDSRSFEAIEHTFNGQYLMPAAVIRLWQSARLGNATTGVADSYNFTGGAEPSLSANAQKPITEDELHTGHDFFELQPKASTEWRTVPAEIVVALWANKTRNQVPGLCLLVSDAPGYRFADSSALNPEPTPPGCYCGVFTPADSGPGLGVDPSTRGRFYFKSLLFSLQRTDQICFEANALAGQVTFAKRSRETLSAPDGWLVLVRQAKDQAAFHSPTRIQAAAFAVFNFYSPVFVAYVVIFEIVAMALLAAAGLMIFSEELVNKPTPPNRLGRLVLHLSLRLSGALCCLPWCRKKHQRLRRKQIEYLENPEEAVCVEITATGPTGPMMMTSPSSFDR